MYSLGTLITETYQRSSINTLLSLSVFQVSLSLSLSLSSLASHLQTKKREAGTRRTQKRKKEIRMKKMSMMMLRKCKSISRHLGRTSSYSSLRSQSARDVEAVKDAQEQNPRSSETVLVGRTRKRYVISKQHLKHPLLNALIEKRHDGDCNCVILVKCEVVLFDHLLWMLDNGDQSYILESLDELADLYLSP
ncbi:PREDICTED: uncharacterized protein LOC104810258 [Tarenaya hassleriana]|uniref:uncharacterized protein LOC104810258 n=1 Tax=Tarenaya hassleriana TaxID=28532 RepID=UPI00053C91DE|nr:PREDICTED: uncharacterized protein LOC104810258 [Tarenaya hassleriana]